jgi:hypothetical protein
MKTSSDAEQYALGRLDVGKMAWMALMLTPGMGPTRIWRAMNQLETAARLFEASLTELEGLGMPAAAAQFVFEGKARAAAEDEMKRVAEAGGTVLTRRMRSIQRGCGRSMIRRRYFGFGETWRCWRGRGLLWWGPGILRLMGRGWRSCCRAIWRIGGWWS